MAFIVEDGTNVANATSYATVAYGDAYFADRGDTYAGMWNDAGTTQEQKEMALIQATDYIDTRFGSRFKGRRANDNQALEWPRQDAVVQGVDVPDDSIPDGLQRAVVEYARRALQFVLAPDPSRDANGNVVINAGPVTETTQQVGPLRTTQKFADPNNYSIQHAEQIAYPYADALMKPYLQASFNQVIRV